MPKKNTGVPYELLAKGIFEQLLQQDHVETIRLEHDVTLEGKTTSHQIDVYWQFKAGGVVYTTCVQAKDWAQPVNQGNVMTFKSVLDDLKTRASGIMVCKSGYQEGAKAYAEGNGILLYELREMRDEDWVGRVRTISIRLAALAPHVSDLVTNVDQGWLNEQKQSHGIHDGEPIHIVGHAGAIRLEAEDGTDCGTMAQVFDLYLPKPLAPMSATRVDHKFDPPVFILTNHERLKRLKLNGFAATFGVEELVQEMVIRGDDLVHFILQNVVDKTAHIFTKDRTLIKEARPGGAIS